MNAHAGFHRAAQSLARFAKQLIHHALQYARLMPCLETAMTGLILRVFARHRGPGGAAIDHPENRS
jgi:hypothetical protein